MMDINSIIGQAEEYYQKKIPFVIYSLPGSDKMLGMFQNDIAFHTTNNFKKDGFIMSPFQHKENMLFIPENKSELIEATLFADELDKEPVTIIESNKDEQLYLQLVKKTVDAIKGREAKKIVVSRYKDFPLLNFNVEKIIKRLFLAYPSAFRYLWYHPQTGIWCGATPETLIEVENNSFKTMALAGTQPFSSNDMVVWGVKEMDEQQLVTEQITAKLQCVTSDLKISEPYTHRAGSLLHLRTDITGVLKNKETPLTTITSALHPTPAVCGTPQEAAREFILENENYSREFYTGFLGPIYQKGASASIMVNLRCMRIQDNTARVFVGGGITLGSNPNDEWTETQNKMQIMLQVLKPML